jgi:hypothetical protein
MDHLSFLVVDKVIAAATIGFAHAGTFARSHIAAIFPCLM